MNRRIVIVSDFDGTIAKRDVGHHFFARFVPDSGEREELLDRWKTGLVSSRECLEREVAWAEATAGDLDRFVDGEILDPFFKDFMDFCNRRGYEFLVLSDGFDYYIDRMLLRFGLGFLDFKANHLVIENGNIVGVEFPHYNLLECSMCGNCKRFFVEELGRRDFYVVYVGNGYSDRCPSGYADLVLAKGDLLVHCQREGMDCIPFTNFRDVEREVTARLILSE